MQAMTIGQYYPGHSQLHRMDPRVKLLAALALMVVLFFCGNFFALGFMALFALGGAVLSGVPAEMLLRSLRPIVMLVVFTSAINIFFYKGEHPLWQWQFPWVHWNLVISQEGLQIAGFTTLRIVCLLVLSSLLTYTTTPTALTLGLERLLAPLARVGVPVGLFAMMMTLALRFVPTLMEETDRIMCAQKSRGAQLETGNFVQRIQAFLPILVPLFVSAFRRASDLAWAMESRCYTGGARTSLRQLHLRLRDVVGLVVVALASGAVFWLNTWAEKVI